MARSNARKSTTRRTSTASTPKPQDEDKPVEATQSDEEQQGVGDPTNDAESAADGVSGPSEDESGGNSDEQQPQKSDEGEAKPRSAKKESKEKNLNSADSKFTTDENGNEYEPPTPNRSTNVTAFYPFEYEDGPEEGTIVATERVYSVMSFYGTTRRGKALAYAKGTVLDRSILEAVDDA